ncbi:MAG TPA: hypothetical protein PK047_01490 [Saprospiraceae bacterium]|jgi:mannose-6-phosphate isomerase|nr:hypothetical protein [Saprospiraceae bacterium]HRO07509.1 hypothetical protein [Saprospiraceae bacterium]HRP40792.1 hypothetical protein [Saprospiraceae bacterium]
MKHKIAKLRQIKKQIIQLGLHIREEDFERPWGGFFKIDEQDTGRFIRQFFPEVEDKIMQKELPLSPKILCVAPRQQLSWQYHDRRAELWKLVSGKAAFKVALTDHEAEAEILIPGKLVQIAQGERHRLVGLNEWGVIAEIWLHVVPEHPSDETDIVRLDDDYGRS